MRERNKKEQKEMREEDVWGRERECVCGERGDRVEVVRKVGREWKEGKRTLREEYTERKDR